MTAQALVSTQIVSPIVDRMREIGFRARDVLSAVGIDKYTLEDVDASIPLSTYVELFERAADIVGNPNFGLEAGKTVEVPTGAINFLFLSAPTLADAFSGLQKYLQVLQEATLCKLEYEGELARFTYQITDEKISPRRQDSEYSITATCNLISRYLGAPFVPHEIWFEHQRVGSHSKYEALLGCEVFFNQSSNSILFEKDLLTVSAPTISRKLYPIIASHLQTIGSARVENTSMSSQVSALLDQRQLTLNPTAPKMAASLGISTSTLSRRLRSEGTSFQKVLTDKRMSIAERHLRHSSVPISEIAIMLGYADATSFSRAFKSWCAETPEHYRESADR